jgi:hypothetical protein
MAPNGVEYQKQIEMITLFMTEISNILAFALQMTF